jgi:hypothetical protein
MDESEYKESQVGVLPTGTDTSRPGCALRIQLESLLEFQWKLPTEKMLTHRRLMYIKTPPRATAIRGQHEERGHR